MLSILFKLVTYVELLIPLVGIGGAIFLWFRKYRKQGILLVISLCGSLLINLSKLFFQRPCVGLTPKNTRLWSSILTRIFGPLKFDSYCYPSAHVGSYVLFWGYFAHVVSRLPFNKNYKKIVVFLVLLPVLLVGPSRIYLGVHRITEVAAGYFAGLTLLLLLLWAEKIVK